MDKVIWDKEVFDAQKFNLALSQYLKDVQMVKNQFENLTGSPRLIRPKAFSKIPKLLSSSGGKN